MSRRLGILGGTFDPIHIGHLQMAQVVCEKMKLDKVIFVPSNLPPHKTAVGLTPADHRLNMVKLAVQDNPFFTVSSCEIEKGGKSYSIDTVQYLSHVFSGGKLFFIIGADAFSTINQWKDIDQIVRIVDFIVVNRPGSVKQKKSKSSLRQTQLVMPGLDISSSFVRQRIAQGKNIHYLVPEKVVRYIVKNKLYLKK